MGFSSIGGALSANQFNPTYGGMFINANSTATTINTVNVWEEVSAGFETGLLSGVTFDTNTLVAGNAGVYLVNATISCISASAGRTFQFAISVNDTIIDKTLAERRFAPSTDIGVLSLTGLLNLSASDVVKLEVRNVAHDTDITIEYANIIISRQA